MGSHTLKGNGKALPELGGKLKTRDPSEGFTAAGISWLGPVCRPHGSGPNREILSRIDLRESPALSLPPQGSFRAHFQSNQIEFPRSVSPSRVQILQGVRCGAFPVCRGPDSIMDSAASSSTPIANGTGVAHQGRKVQQDEDRLV